LVSFFGNQLESESEQGLKRGLNRILQKIRPNWNYGKARVRKVLIQGKTGLKRVLLGRKTNQSRLLTSDSSLNIPELKIMDGIFPGFKLAFLWE